MANFFGTGSNDTLTGLPLSNDNIFGFGGDDNLIGDSGNDVLVGGNDGDTLTGGLGQDILEGGADFDSFIYTAVADSKNVPANRDIIADFQGNGAGAGDEIDLSTIDANVNANFPGVDAFLPTQLTYDAVTGILSVDVIGDPGNVDMQIQLIGAPPLDIANDIVI